jgi:methylmalonyl-CoA/ethylmalonyl-CoA epimerase
MPGLDHVAILVSDLDAAVRLYRDVYGLELAEIEEVPTEKVRVAIFGHGAGRIELVCPTDPESPLAKRIKEKGEGLHHVCLAVPDVEQAMAALRARGAPLLDERPRPGAGGSRVAFVHPKGSRGVLVELKQGGGGH